MNTTIYHPSPSEMPEGFQFPQEYLDMIALGEDNYDDMGFWSFMCYYKGFMSDWIESLKEDYPYLHVVPFARSSNTDEIACFDNNNPTQVLCINFMDKPGEEVNGVWPTFNDWLSDIFEIAEEGWDNFMRAKIAREAAAKEAKENVPQPQKA